jgi:Protein of unknown function (DUF3616)
MEHLRAGVLEYWSDGVLQDPGLHHSITPSLRSRVTSIRGPWQNGTGSGVLSLGGFSATCRICRAELVLGLLLAGMVCANAAEKYRMVRPAQYTGMADASGAVVVGSNLFLVADDETNVLQLYSRETGGAALAEFDCNPFLQPQGKSLEADLEAGALLGQRAFWLGSHGRNKNGKARPNRAVLFGTDIAQVDGRWQVSPVGRPYRSLLQDLASQPQFDRFRLAEAAKGAPTEPGALNIEGLAATPEGHLMIGFRNPLPEGRALLIPLLNPNEVLEGASGRFGAAVLLDLGGLGIRDIALYQGEYVLIAGPYHGGGPFRFYHWEGPGARPHRLHVQGLKDYHPEALVIYPDLGLEQFQVLSDDGKRVSEGVSARQLPWSRKTFRTFWLKREE